MYKYSALARARLLLCLIFLWFWGSVAFAGESSLGVYYFPGWSSNQRGNNFSEPWRNIRPYSNREPYIGWYSDSDPSVLRVQADQMRRAGLDFVVFDSYWDRRGPYLEQSVSAYASIWKSSDPYFALMWANHFSWSGGISGFQAMLDHWISKYMLAPGYFRVHGRPVLFVFSVEFFARNARDAGIAASDLGDLIQQRALKAGLPGIYLIGGAPALEHWVKAVAPNAGFSAISAYNYHYGYSGSVQSQSALPASYADLRSVYQKNWDWMIKSSPLPYVVPMSSGWDKTPWLNVRNGETTYKAIADPQEFEDHLRDAAALMKLNPEKTLNMGVICCWNEYGEGSFIEPTKSKGSQLLDRVERVFGR